MRINRAYGHMRTLFRDQYGGVFLLAIVRNFGVPRGHKRIKAEGLELWSPGYRFSEISFYIEMSGTSAKVREFDCM